jgi:hypothetical protein
MNDPTLPVKEFVAVVMVVNVLVSIYDLLAKFNLMVSRSHTPSRVSDVF